MDVIDDTAGEVTEEILACNDLFELPKSTPNKPNKNQTPKLNWGNLFLIKQTQPVIFVHSNPTLRYNIKYILNI